MSIYLNKARRTAERELDRVLRAYEPRVARAFKRAVAAVKNQATLRAIAAALEVGNIPKAVELASLSEAMVGSGLPPGQPSLQDEVIAVFGQGGVSGMQQLPKSMALRASLDITNPEAIRFVSEYIPRMIREVSAETQSAVREAIERGFQEGRPPVEVAREVRENVGLTRKQGRAVANFRRQLETGQLGSGKTPWTRRLSATERAQARSIFTAGGERSARVDRLVNRYHESLVNRRARNIARTEVHRAHQAGQQELWRQAAETGLLQPDRTRRRWIVTPDDRLRASHAAIPGMNRDGVRLDEPFSTPFGPVMGPEDEHEELINCRCATALFFID